MSKILFFGKEVRILFSIGDRIVYGSEGVFTVTEYTSSPVDKNDTRQFYILRPVHGPVGNIIITPMGNDKVKMRAVMTREEALKFVDSIPSIPTLTVEREKNRRDIYRQSMSAASCKEFISIIKTVAERKAEYAKLKKRVSESDNEYEKKAKFCLYGELSIALDIPVDEVDAYIAEKLSAVNA